MQPPDRNPTPPVPLYRALSKFGIASRTQAQEMIERGHISVNGAICTDPAHMVRVETESISRNGHELVRAPQSVIKLYKPKGIITSRKDEQNRPTVYSLLPQELHTLHCVGRLDFATSGLLLLTNNTMLSAWLTDPAHAVARVYVCTVRGMVTEDDAQKMRAGIVDKGETLHTEAVLVRKASGRESHLVLTLTQGKNREIRRLCKALGHEVTRLKRVSFGGLTLGTLQPGQFREVSAQELEEAFPGLPT
jgi:23S rRNA pseudouridine2605 synthase